MNEIPIEDLNSRFRYDCETGELFRVSGGALKSIENKTSQFGYIRIYSCGKHLSAHRMAFAIYFGRWPKLHLDHVNGNRSDNRIENLRESTVIDNGRNRGLSITNKSGCSGVCYHKRDRKWYAQIFVNKKPIHLGVFDDLGAAICARKKAEDLYFLEYKPAHRLSFEAANKAGK